MCFVLKFGNFVSNGKTFVSCRFRYGWSHGDGALARKRFTDGTACVCRCVCVVRKRKIAEIKENSKRTNCTGVSFIKLRCMSVLDFLPNLLSDLLYENLFYTKKKNYPNNERCSRMTWRKALPALPTPSLSRLFVQVDPHPCRWFSSECW